MNSLCDYKNMFGKPNEGIHATRLFGVAIWDVIFTVIAALLISHTFKKNIYNVLLLLFIIAIIIHSIFCVETAVNKTLYNIIFS